MIINHKEKFPALLFLLLLVIFNVPGRHRTTAVHLGRSLVIGLR